MPNNCRASSIHMNTRSFITRCLCKCAVAHALASTAQHSLQAQHSTATSVRRLQTPLTPRVQRAATLNENARDLGTWSRLARDCVVSITWATALMERMLLSTDAFSCALTRSILLRRILSAKATWLTASLMTPSSRCLPPWSSASSHASSLPATLIMMLIKFKNRYPLSLLALPRAWAGGRAQHSRGSTTGTREAPRHRGAAGCACSPRHREWRRS